MSLLKQIVDKGATTAWSPIKDIPNHLAIGTKDSGAGSGFENTGGELSICSLDLASDAEPEVVQSCKTDSGFSCLAWGSKNGSGMGVLAGGMQSGIVNFWDPTNLGMTVSQVARHKKKVNCLQFNPHVEAANLLATGASDSEVYIMDLNDPTHPSVYSPAGPECQAKHTADVSAVAWNSQVVHILASAALNGSCTVWDLKQKKPWCELRDPKGAAFTALAWNPSQGLHLLTATDDDQRPVLRLWDLRSSTTNPLAEFHGHTGGIFSVDWCPHDKMSLLSCAKDNRTILWDLLSGQPTYELVDAAGSQPSAGLNQSMNSGNAGDVFGGKSAGGLGGGTGRRYEVRWAPHLKGVISTCSFDRKVEVFSLNAAGSGPTGKSGRAPQWLARRSAVNFGFGGKLVSCSGSTVTLSTVVDEPNFLQKATEFESSLSAALARDQEDFQMRQQQQQQLLQQQQQQQIQQTPEEVVMEHKNLIELCLSKSASSSDTFDKEIWQFITVWFESSGARDKISQMLGFNIEEISNEVESSVVIPGKVDEPPAVEQNTGPATGLAELTSDVNANDVFNTAPSNDMFNGPSANDIFSSAPASDVNDVFNSAPAENAFNSPPPTEDALGAESALSPENAFNAPPPPEPMPSSAPGEAEQVAATSAPVGEEGPPRIVEYSNPAADELIKKALLICNFDAAVQCCLDNNRLADALLLATCGGEELWNNTIDAYLKLQMSNKPYMPLLSAIIKNRLTQLVADSTIQDNKWKEVLATISQYAKSEEFATLCEQLGQRLEGELGAEGTIAATLCYMCAINVEKVVDIWVREAYQSQSSDALQKIIELISVYRHAVQETTSVQGYPAVMKQYLAYAQTLSQQGELDYAASYLALMDTTIIDPNDAQWNGEPPAHWEERNQLSFDILVLLDRIYGAHKSPQQSLSHIIPQRWFPFETKQVGVAPVEEFVQPSAVPAQAPASGYGQTVGTGYGGAAPQTPAVGYGGAQQQQQQFAPQQQASVPQPAYNNPPQTYAQPTPPQPTYNQQQPPAQQQQWNAPQQQSYTNGSMSTQPPVSQQPTSYNNQFGATPSAPPTKPIPVNDGFGTTAGNASAGAKYGNYSSVPPAPVGNFNAPMNGSANNPMQPQQPKPVTIMQPGVPQGQGAPQQPQAPPEPKPAPVPVKREMPPGMQPVIDSLRQYCQQLSAVELTQLDTRQLMEGNKSLETLNEKLMTGKINTALQQQLKDLATAVQQYDLKRASQIRLAITRSSWAEQKDWLKGFTHLVNLGVKKFTPQ